MDADDYLYHVTYYNRLAGISERGLVPGARPSIGGAPYAGHKRGRVFMTVADGLSYWFERSELWAEDASDSPGDDGLIPVVVRFPWPVEGSLSIDKPGTKDARWDAYVYSCSIAPGEIELWSGSRWVPVDRWEYVDSSLGIERIPIEETYGSEEKWLSAGAPEELSRLVADSPLLPDVG